MCAELKQKKGELKIFLGYSIGTGKTYAMLQAAISLKQHGADVVVGYLNPDKNPKTLSMQDGLEVLATKKLKWNGETIQEFDLDGALQRKPEYILIDDMAHTNPVGFRHEKRYKDIEELLNMGIHVYTTLNIQHLESLNDRIASITGIIEKERIPDSIFEEANQVEFIDLEPEELLNRIKDDHYYKCKTNETFCTIERLTALRELTLRCCANRLNRFLEEEKSQYPTKEHILVCLSASPSNEKILRTAARMAVAFSGEFTAVYVETTNAKDNEKIKNALHKNMKLARQLGAKVEIVYGDDISFQIAEFARLSGVTKIVIGRSSIAKNPFFRKPSLTEHLIADVPNLEVHIIPDSEQTTKSYRKNKENHFSSLVFSVHDILWSIGILVLTSCIGLLFQRLQFVESNIIMVYVLGVLIISIVTKNQIYSLIASIVSVLIFNFLFTEPRFTLHAYSQGYPVTFVIMFVVSFLTGTLAVRLKNHAKSLAQSAFRTKVLFDTNQILQKVTKKDEIISTTAQQLNKLLGKTIVFYPVENETLGDVILFLASEDTPKEKYLLESEREAALWVLRNNKHAGASTQTFSEAECLYLAVRINDVVYGVIGIDIEKEPLDAFDHSMLLSIVGECALSLENEKHAREKEEAAVLARNEQLKANLLRSISHDLRTPLTSISGNASNLLHNSKFFDENTKSQLYLDIYDDSMWLINLVENLLSITRLEENRLHLNITDDLIDDVVEEALRHINRRSVKYHIEVKHEDEFLLAKMDARLIVQVVINIVNNAIQYTKEGSHILIYTRKEDNEAVVSIMDDGDGMSDEMKKHVFDMFYTGGNQVADSRRSLGLGLALCKSIIQMHNGQIMVTDNIPHGTNFTFRLPAGEVHIHE